MKLPQQGAFPRNATLVLYVTNNWFMCFLIDGAKIEQFCIFYK